MRFGSAYVHQPCWSSQSLSNDNERKQDSSAKDRLNPLLVCSCLDYLSYPLRSEALGDMEDGQDSAGLLVFGLYPIRNIVRVSCHFHSTPLAEGGLHNRCSIEGLGACFTTQKTQQHSVRHRARMDMPTSSSRIFRPTPTLF